MRIVAVADIATLGQTVLEGLPSERRISAMSPATLVRTPYRSARSLS